MAQLWQESKNFVTQSVVIFLLVCRVNWEGWWYLLVLINMYFLNSKEVRAQAKRSHSLTMLECKLVQLNLLISTQRTATWLYHLKYFGFIIVCLLMINIQMPFPSHTALLTIAGKNSLSQCGCCHAQTTVTPFHLAEATFAYRSPRSSGNIPKNLKD